MKKTKIGFFDSGIGGVTVLRECIKLNPKYEYIYYSDSKHNPYGDKKEEEVISYARKITEYLYQQGCKIIVIACNTASAIAVETLRKEYENIIFIAIEPAIKLAYERIGATLIMATKGTLDSERFHELYEKYHNDEFYLMSCVGLANLIEDGNKEKIENYLKENLKEYQDKNIKNVVLGCTHYPLIKDKIKSILGDVNIFDGSIGVAKRLNSMLIENEFEPENIVDKKDILFSNIKFIDSSKEEYKEKRFYEFLKEK